MRELAIVWSAAAYEFLLPWAQRGLLLVVLFGGPLALFKRTRPYAAQGMSVTSYAIGLTTWSLGATVSFATFGFLGLFIGLFLMGLGVVFVGMVGAVVVMGAWDLALSLLVMSVLTYALRFAAAWLVAKDEQDSVKHAHRLHEAYEEGRGAGRQEALESDEEELSRPWE